MSARLPFPPTLLPFFVVFLMLPAAGKAHAADPGALGGLSDSFETLVDRVSPAVVQVFVTGYAPALGKEAGGITLYAKQRGTGSGVVVDPSGYILTNAHVIRDAERVKVLLASDPGGEGGRGSVLSPAGRTLPAEVVGFDEETDLAVLKVSGEGMPSLPFADSEELRAGELIFAFGSPMGLSTSVTMGVVSAPARQLEPDHPMIYIQTDAAINPGNSGGPLVNTSGELVGVNTLILSRSGGAEGLGFAAPSNIASHVYRQIREHGRVRRGTIGVQAQTITPALATGLGLSRASGVVVADVLPQSAGDAAGLRVGDLVLTLDGKTMENARQFDVNLYQRTPGETVTLVVERNQANRNVRVLVEERVDDPLRFSDLVSLEQNLVPGLGILVIEIGPDLDRRLPPRRRPGGLLVAARAGGALPWRVNLEPGDIIYTVNRQEIQSLDGLRSTVASIPGGTPLVLQIERDRKLLYVTLETD